MNTAHVQSRLWAKKPPDAGSRDSGVVRNAWGGGHADLAEDSRGCTSSDIIDIFHPASCTLLVWCVCACGIVCVHIHIYIYTHIYNMYVCTWPNMKFFRNSCQTCSAWKLFWVHRVTHLLESFLSNLVKLQAYCPHFP